MEIDGGPSFDGTNMLAFVDALFAQNVDEYSNHPENLMKDVKERCSPYFKNCKSLNARGCIADHGELVRMRCMIQDVKGAEIFLASGIADADEQNATERPVCGILRDTITCSSVKEVVAMRTRYNYTVVPVPGATDWFIELFHGPSSALDTVQMTSGSDGNSGNASSLSSPASSLKSFAVKAKFFCESAEDLLPNHIFDLYGVMDKTAIIHTDDHDAFGEMLLVELPRVHVIQFEAVEHHDFIALASPEVLMVDHAMAMRDVRNALNSLLGDQTCADYMLCHLISTTYARPESHPICSMPLNLINVSDSRPIIRMLKALLPKVQVIELAASMLSDEMFIPVMDHERDVLKQGPLQLTNGTLLILDETELSSGVMRLAGNAEKNIAALRCIVSSQKVDYDYVFYQLPLHCDINVLILSRHPSVIIEVPFTVALPPQFTDGLDPTVEMIRSAQGQMDCRRHALLTSRKAVKDVEITDSINKVIEDGFMRMRESSSREDAGAQLHRLLTISRLLAAIDRKKEVDEECWNKARTMEVKRRVGLAELLR
ncbi:Mini-chromosome maintenance complex-binding protein [Toxocara canis]|uniref:Mini-chromosome maintenance complex-binding protein n=1 Tax=Toxocara canis TaxID=6265 RepID=A0A0B2V656_TOXCA|nr:Mini-chromosome maintenance complex-binding protein [Toxocara canis]